MTDFEQNNSMTAPVMACQGVQRIYQQDTVPVYALRGADLTINAGEFVSLAGPSGSGKSTLLNVIGGLDGFDAGRRRRERGRGFVLVLEERVRRRGDRRRGKMDASRGGD